MNESKFKQLLAGGPLRELVTTVFGLLGAYGLVNDQLAPALMGAAVALVMIIQGWASNQDVEKILTLVRKFFSLVPGLLLALEWVTPDQSAAIGAMLVPLISIFWSAWFKLDAVDSKSISGL